MQETKEQWIERLKQAHPDMEVKGDTIIAYPGGPLRNIQPCDGSCDFEECTGWVALRPGEEIQR